VILQAFRDFCSENHKDVAGVFKWLSTPDFIHTAHMAQVDEHLILETFKRLGQFKPSVRKKMLREISRQIYGGPSQ
tara:strand:+ start:1351 stop:1578 length:228 start_codon:yes stop_codon:yes gene_type:complete